MSITDASRSALVVAACLAGGLTCVVETQRTAAPPDRAHPEARTGAANRAGDHGAAPGTRDDRAGTGRRGEATSLEGVSSTGGDVTAVDAPQSLVPGASEIDHELQVFGERQGLELGRPLLVDTAIPGEYTDQKRLGRTEIPVGTVVNSYYVHYDPVGEPDGQNSSGSVTFEDPIVGIISREKSMDQSFEILGLEALPTEYPKRGQGHGKFALDLDGGEDSFTISEDRERLSLSTTTWGSTDSVRVITSPTLVRAPAAESSEPAAGAGVVAVRAPESAIPGALERDRAVQLFRERAGYPLASELAVDAAEPGSYSRNMDLRPATLSADTRVTSYYVHYDPTGSSSRRTVTGWVTFPQRIVGVITRERSLDESAGPLALDELGTSYPRRGQGHGQFAVDLGGPDRFWIAADGKTLMFTLRAKKKTDSFRVLTSAP